MYKEFGELTAYFCYTNGIFGIEKFEEFKKLTGLNMTLAEAKAKNPLYDKTEKELLEAVRKNEYNINRFLRLL